MAVRLHDGGIVGEGVAVGLAVGSIEQLDVEHLGSLYETVVAAHHIFLGRDMAQGLNDGHDGNDGLGSTGSLVATTDDVYRDKRSHAVVNAHHALDIVGDEGEAILNGVETCLATVCKKIGA